MHLNYLDAENELASLDILSELEITTTRGLEDSMWLHIRKEEWNQSNRWLAEGAREVSCINNRVAYLVLSGEIFFDVRDSGDNWIRCHVG